MTTRSGNLAGWASGLSLGDVPERVVAYARTQILSQLGGIRAGRSHPFGERVAAAFGSPLQADPRRAAYVLAALSVGLDYDDAAYAGHLSHSAVNVPLAYSSVLGLSGADLLTAVIAANECAARVTAAATIGPFRGQTAAHTHLVGAVAGRLRAESAPAAQWVSAWGLALALPPWPIGRGFFGSDAKVLVASVPVQIGLDACDAAGHGLVGAADLLEHPDGFLARYADVPLPDAVDAALGERWHTETFSFKRHPGSPGIGAAIACAIELHAEFAGRAPVEVAEIVVGGSLFTARLAEGTAGFVAGPDSPLAALNYSLGYNTATALLTGDLRPADFAPPLVADPDRWRLAGKVRVEHDPALSLAAIAATAPIGEALRQAGGRADGWVRERAGEELAGLMSRLGPPAASFETATKRLGARVTVRYTDGRAISAALAAAPGSLGADPLGEQHRLVRAKFAATGGADRVSDAVERLPELTREELADTIHAALADPASERR